MVYTLDWPVSLPGLSEGPFCKSIGTVYYVLFLRTLLELGNNANMIRDVQLPLSYQVTISLFNQFVGNKRYSWMIMILISL